MRVEGVEGVGAGLAVGWWSMNLGDGACSVWFCMCSKFSLSQKFFFLMKIVKNGLKKINHSSPLRDHHSSHFDLFFPVFSLSTHVFVSIL